MARSNLPKNLFDPPSFLLFFNIGTHFIFYQNSKWKNVTKIIIIIIITLFQEDSIFGTASLLYGHQFTNVDM